MNKLQINPDILACNIAIGEFMTYIAVSNVQKLFSGKYNFLIQCFLANHLLCLFLKVEVASVIRFCFPMSLTCAFYGLAIDCEFCQKFSGRDLLSECQQKIDRTA